VLKSLPPAPILIQRVNALSYLRIVYFFFHLPVRTGFSLRSGSENANTPAVTDSQALSQVYPIARRHIGSTQTTVILMLRRLTGKVARFGARRFGFIESRELDRVAWFHVRLLRDVEAIPEDVE